MRGNVTSSATASTAYVRPECKCTGTKNANLIGRDRKVLLFSLLRVFSQTLESGSQYK